MKRTICGLILLNYLISCSGPSYFNSPSDFVGGNRAAAVETHCAREAGANKVYFASAAPAIKYQNLYGIDMPATAELIASNKSNEQVAKEINADWLIYQTLDDLVDSVREGNPEIKEFETSIFTGKYFTPLVENYLEELEISRKDELKMQREKTKAKG